MAERASPLCWKDLMSPLRRWPVMLFALAAALAPAVALAHGNAAEPRLRDLWLRWEFDPLFLLFSGFSLWLYLSAVRRVNRAHPKSPFPRRRVACFVAGFAVLAFALISPPASYDTVLFSVHMWQHLLLTSVAAPLILLGTPITLALRAASVETRRRILLPMLHSRLVRIVSFPVVAWLLFAATMWLSHYSPLYDDALENAWLHRVEHLLYLTAAMMFWWQAIGLDPTPWRMSHPVRLLYVFLQMPQNSFLALSIYSSSHVIYKHYETLGRTWGPTPLADQQQAGIIMWVAGDLLFLGAICYVIASWVKAEELETKRQDRAQAKRKAEATLERASPSER
ncbi:MAG: cytochrome c oxidase assembly protein [Tepidiformaceae bacterium]